MAALRTLKREKLTIEADPPDSVDQDLARRAARSVGYHTAEREAHDLANETDAWVHVADEFHRLGIQPFTEKSVKSYKTDCIWAALSRRGKAFTVTDKLCIWTARATAITTVISLIALATSVTGWYSWVPWCISSVTSLVLLVAMAITGEWASSKRGEEEVDFRHEHIGQYAARMPAYVMQTACDVKDSIPGASLHILRCRVVPKNGDNRFSSPMLTFRLHDRQLYLEAWNEDRFDATRPGAIEMAADEPEGRTLRKVNIRDT